MRERNDQTATKFGMFPILAKQGYESQDLQYSQIDM